MIPRNNKKYIRMEHVSHLLKEYEKSTYGDEILK